MAVKLHKKGVALDREERIKENENLEMIEREFDSFQSQVNQLVVSGDSSPQAAQASIGVDGVDYGGNLKARLDAEQLKVLNELDKNKKSLDLKKANAQAPLDIPTYYNGDNHALHPSALYFPTKKYGYELIMTFTPYSEGRDRYENPSIVVSDDKFTWKVPPGLVNPVIPQPPTGFHYSDPFLIDNGTELELWYRLTDKLGGKSKLLMIKTNDLVNWTAPMTVFDYGEVNSSYISPSGHIENGVYKIWYRNVEGKYVLVQSSDLVQWSAPVEVVYNYREYSAMGYGSWHDEIKLIDGKYIAVVNTNPDPAGELFLFESTDGIHFNVIRKIMEPSLNGFDNGRLYKASIVKIGVWHYLYYSALDKINGNHIGLTRCGALGTEFSGVTVADLEYHKKKGARYAAIYGDKDTAPVEFPTGIVGKRGSVTDQIARFANFYVQANGGAGTFTALSGDAILSVESVSWGLRINFKNMPAGKVPHADIQIGTPEGLLAGATGIGYFYIRSIDATGMVIGLKTAQATTGHTQWSSITFGLLRIGLLY